MKVWTTLILNNIKKDLINSNNFVEDRFRPIFHSKAQNAPFRVNCFLDHCAMSPTRRCVIVIIGVEVKYSKMINISIFELIWCQYFPYAQFGLISFHVLNQYMHNVISWFQISIVKRFTCSFMKSIVIKRLLCQTAFR